MRSTQKKTLKIGKNFLIFKTKISPRECEMAFAQEELFGVLQWEFHFIGPRVVDLHVIGRLVTETASYIVFALQGNKHTLSR